MASWLFPKGVGHKLNLLLAKEMNLDPAQVIGIRSTHEGGYGVRIEATVVKSITVDRFNEFFRAAQEGESAPVIEGSNAIE